jgi:Tol biopolymer transport system component/DNA-binding winged helix-turn-helix (wHTH) protein
MEALKQQQPSHFFEFGPFRVDTAKCVLLRNGEAVPLSLKVFEILVVLIENRGQLLEKDELLRQVWPDTVVEENNLARSISALRKALDEQPNEHRYILTVPSRGYRFVADVREIEQGGESNPGTLAASIDHEAEWTNRHDVANVTMPAARPAALRIGRRSGLLLMLGICVIGITVVLFALLIRASSKVDQTPVPRKLWQLTFDGGLQSEPTWSPDGRMIAYSSDRSGNFDIWVQPVGEGNPIRITSSLDHDWQPDWAPEGNRIVFRSERDGGGLYVVPVLGGNERKISSFGYRPRWSPDGSQILFSSILRTVNEIPKFYVVALEGDSPREVLSEFLPQFNSLRVGWYPDGKRLSLWGNHREQGWSFWTVPLPEGPPVRSELAAKVVEQLKQADVSFTDFQWSPQGRALYFEGVSRGVRNLWKVEVDPRSLRWTSGPERLTTGTGMDTDMTLSPDGKRLAFTARTERTRLWSLPFDCNAGKIKAAGQPLTAPGADAFYPELSRDGQKLAFVAQRAEKRELLEKSLRDGHETLLMPADGFLRAFPHWSRDGARLAYLRLRPVGPDHPQIERAIAMLSVGGREEQLLTTIGTTSEVPWDWSADGKWILAGSDRQSVGRRSICMFPVAAVPHAETQMSVVTSDPEQNLYQAHFSPDNRWISFCAARALEAGVSTIYVVPTSGGEWKRITESKYFDDKPRWSPDGRTLYFISNRAGFFNVWGIRFDPASGQTIGDAFRVTAFQSPGQMILPDVGIMEMALAEDSLILPITEVSGGIWVLENLGQ